MIQLTRKSFKIDVAFFPPSDLSACDDDVLVFLEKEPELLSVAFSSPDLDPGFLQGNFAISSSDSEVLPQVAGTLLQTLERASQIYLRANHQ